MPLAAAVTERWLAPAVRGRLVMCQPEPELPVFAVGLCASRPAAGGAERVWKRIPVAAPVERVAAARSTGIRLVARPATPEPELPAFALALCASGPVQCAAIEEAWSTLPAAAPVERLCVARTAACLALPFATIEPTLDCLTMADPASNAVPDSGRAIPQPQTGEPALSAAGPIANFVISPPVAHQPGYRGYFPSGPQREAPALPEALSARSLATPVSGRVPAKSPMRLPHMDGGPAPSKGLPSAPFVNPAAPPAQEKAMPRQIQQVPVATVTLHQPKAPEPAKFAALPLAELMPLEYFCSRGQRAHPHGVGWIIPSLAATAPRFTSPLMIERVESLPATPASRRKRPAFAEIFTLPEAASARSNKLREWSKLIAACLVIGAMIWYGSSFLRSDHDSGAGQTLVAEEAHGLQANPVESGSGVFHRVRSAVSRRAEVHLNDGFQKGMAAWGATAQTMAPGWVRHLPDGYVTPGKLALYRPTRTYTDYRFEFFGQIESKSMDWAVRASDESNYYAMKFAADGPGPRAVVSMVHYPVVAGQKGPRVVTPLSIMIHEHTPYHVEVDVQGDRVTTSIEGEQVDSFTDATLARGGVGFFTEAGEQARLYWVKVSRNEDWLGRVCAFLSGGGSSTAQLLPPAGTMPRPDSGSPDSTNHFVLAAGFGFMRRNVFRRISDHRRFSLWRS
jgi:hypothetical protein